VKSPELRADRVVRKSVEWIVVELDLLPVGSLALDKRRVLSARPPRNG
jgi:hypothetical protein